MLDFRSPRRLPNYLGRSVQGRLLLLVLAAGLSILVLVKARDPRNWRWVAALTAAPGASKSPDTKLAAPSEGAPADGYRVGPSDAATSAERKLPETAGNPLEAVRDDTPFRAAERTAVALLAQRLVAADSAALQSQSVGQVTFAQLFQQPAEYRGKVVSVHGTVRRVVTLPGRADNPSADWYQCTVQTADNPSAPLIAYVLNLPTGFPRGESLSADVRVTGYFLKRWAYTGSDGQLYTAPLILAATLDWLKPVAASAEPIGPGQVALWIGVAFLLASLLVLALARRLRRPRVLPSEPVWPEVG